jgi:enoyl-CoA hydratase
MLAAMCDLIVAADDAQFSNPVLRMGGVGVELLIEPWELGARKAKEFLFCAEVLDGEEAAKAGLVNRVVPREDLAMAAREMAGRAAQVPPITAAAVKDTINHTLDTAGQRESWRYHFMVHQFVSNTADALSRTEARRTGGMDAVIAEQADKRD